MKMIKAVPVCSSGCGRMSEDDKGSSCMFCDGSFISDPSGEQWVQCVEWQKRAHTGCTAGTNLDFHMCDFCD